MSDTENPKRVKFGSTPSQSSGILIPAASLDTDPPFSYLPPDVIIDHIITRIPISLIFGCQRFLRDGQDLEKKKNPLLCWGRFCRDPGRYPWFIFRNLYGLNSHTKSQFVLCAKKIVFLTIISLEDEKELARRYLVGLSRTAYELMLAPFSSVALPLPRMNLLENLTVEKDCMARVLSVALCRPNWFPSLRFFGAGVSFSVEGIHESNFRNLKSLRIAGQGAGAGDVLSFLSFPDKLQSLNLSEPMTLPVLELLATFSKNLVRLSLDFEEDSEYSEEMNCPRLRSVSFNGPLALFFGPGPPISIGRWTFSNQLQELSLRGVRFDEIFKLNRNVLLNSLRKLTLSQQGRLPLVEPGTCWEELIEMSGLDNEDESGEFFNVCIFPKLLSFRGFEGLTNLHSPKLKSLENGKVTSEFLRNSLPALPELESVVLASTDDAEVNRSDFVSVGNLRSVRFRFLRLSGDFLSGEFSNLEYLYLSDCSTLGDCGGKFPSLTRLSLVGCGSCEAFFQTSRLPNLSFLRIDETPIEGVGWQVLPSLTSLCVLASFPVGAELFRYKQSVAKFPVLKRLTIWGSIQVPKQNDWGLGTALNLETLITSCEELTAHVRRFLPSCEVT